MNKKLMKYLPIIIAIITVIIIIVIVAVNRSFQGYKNLDAIKLQNLLEKKGWIHPQNQFKNQMLGDVTRNPNRKLPTIPPFPNVDPLKKQCPTGTCPGLGKGFYLSKINLSNPSELLVGSDIFLKITAANTCQKYKKGSRSVRTLVTTNNTEELVSNISNENNIQGSIPLQVVSVKPTIMYNTKYDVNKHNNIKTSRLIILDETNIASIENNNTCRRSNCNPEFISDFKNLPVKINKPEINSEWQPFYKFLNKWGSHIMTQIIFGSKLERWESYLDTASDKGKNLEAKLCADVDGIVASATGITAAICSKYSKEQREKASTLETNESTVIVGGTAQTRESFILTGITDENIKNFLDSSTYSDQAIGYNFAPIWEIYQQVSTSDSCIADMDAGNPLTPECKDLQRCLNLEAAYAYQTVNCDLLTTTNDKIYQSFKKVTDIPNINTFKCVVGKEGCSDSKVDCHLKGGGCKAYGPSAFEKGEDYFSGLYKTKVRGVAEGSAYDGINNSCNFTGTQCKCDALWSGGLNERIIWDQGDRN